MGHLLGCPVFSVAARSNRDSARSGLVPRETKLILVVELLTLLSEARMWLFKFRVVFRSVPDLEVAGQYPVTEGNMGQLPPQAGRWLRVRLPCL